MHVEYPPYRKLEVPTNWTIRRVYFYDVSPDSKEKFKTNAEDDGWTIFKQELLTASYDKKGLSIDMGWGPQFDSGGRYFLDLVKTEEWETVEAVCETRRLEEITDAVNQTMLKISLENGDYPDYPQGLRLQEFTPDYYVRYVKNEFFDIEPSEHLTPEQWKLFQEEMLVMEHYKDSDWRITAGWFPAFDPHGQYRIRVSLEKLDNEMYEVFETKEKKEAVRYIDEVFSVHLKKLYDRYNRKVKADKDRARQLKLQIQRNLKI